MARELLLALYTFPDERVGGTEPDQTQRTFMSKPWAGMSLRSCACASSFPEGRIELHHVPHMARLSHHRGDENKETTQREDTEPSTQLSASLP